MMFKIRKLQNKQILSVHQNYPLSVIHFVLSYFSYFARYLNLVVIKNVIAYADSVITSPMMELRIIVCAFCS